jgi:O-antigen ligase
MAALFNIKDSLANKISYYHLMALLVSLPFDLFYSHLILISYVIHTLIHLKKEHIKPIFNTRVLALQSVFLLTVCSTIYSFNKPEAFNEWGKQITILVFPLVFCLNPLDIRKYQPKLLQTFAWVCTATVIYLYADAFITIRHYRLSWSTIFSDRFTNHNFSEPIDMHATFFSMQLMVALAYLLSYIIRERNSFGRLFNFVCCLILTAGIIQLSSKSILLALVIIINVAIPWFLFRGRARVKFIIASMSLTILVGSAILAFPTFKYRLGTLLKVDLAEQTVGETYDSRLTRWETTFELIKKKPLIGYGAGTEIGLLQDGFYRKKMYDSFLQRLNGHSEYLSIALKSGIIGLLVYLATIAMGFKTSTTRKDLPFFAFITVIALVSVSENLLDVDKGTFFYAFFFSFFMFSVEKRQGNQIPGSGELKIIIAEEKVLTEAQIQY